jgi:hypothetical protein
MMNAEPLPGRKVDFLRHGSGVRWHEKAPDHQCVRGHKRHRRTIGRIIPCRVASPQSPTPFHPAATT